MGLRSIQRLDLRGGFRPRLFDSRSRREWSASYGARFTDRSKDLNETPPDRGMGVTTEQALREFIAMVGRGRSPGPGFRRVVAEVRLLAGETIDQILDGTRPAQGRE